MLKVPLTASPPKRIVSASVRDVVAFVLRTGDLGGAGAFASQKRALEGTRGHQRVQKSRPAAYQPEVIVSWRHEAPDFIFELAGRIDGVLVQNSSLLVEEIKTVQALGPADPLHWAQAKIYAFLYASQHGFAQAEIQLTYLDLESGQIVQFQEHYPIGFLETFFQSVIDEYLAFISEHQRWLQARDRSIAESSFPFKTYRTGQRSLAVAAYRAIKGRGRLFAEAPTGIGKTISVLFPAIKAMGQGEVEKIFYLTAKTIGRTVVQKTLGDLCSTGMRLRSLTITAKDKICFNNGEPCDLKACPFAIGYHDRVKAALRDVLQNDIAALTKSTIEDLAKKHQVCPFELSLDLSIWADVAICDYNYLFDPSVSLKRHFAEGRHDYAILVDEAHNLLDRAREMFSAELDKQELKTLKEALEKDLHDCARAISKMLSQLSAIPKQDGWIAREGSLVRKDPPETIKKPLELFLGQAELWLASNQASSFRPDLLEAYFRFLEFQRVLALYDERYTSIYNEAAGKLRLFCIDPSALLRKVLDRIGSTIFFSATLRPAQYFQDALGGDAFDPLLQLDSPFPQENLCILVQNKISTLLRSRADSYEAVAASIVAMVGSKQGNYLVYFPSYDYLNEVAKRFEKILPNCKFQAQQPGMSETQRQEFVESFQSGSSQTLVGFAVLGGVFGEGIDLIGERLIGVVIVGVGLPQISLERDLIKEYSQSSGRPGFAYAYTYPGMNRVLQAVGRVIRSESDRGAVLLIDERFGQRQYRDLFPAWWKPRITDTVGQIKDAVTQFWASRNFLELDAERT